MIVTVTLNAAIDKCYQVEGLRTGEVNRVINCTNTAGGKGLNVARVAALAGEEVAATGFAGGHTGELLRELARRDGITPEFVSIPGESRVCINIIDTQTGIQTELLEAGQEVPRRAEEKLMRRYQALLSEADVVAICGSAPRGIEPELYVRMIQDAKRAAIPVLADTSGELLRECIEAKPFLVKPNQDELLQLTGKEELSRKELIDTAVRLGEQGISYVVVSLGKDGSLLVTATGIYEAKVPDLSAVNTVGCGDSMVAGFAVGIKHHWSDEKCLRFASAISAANALMEGTGCYRQEDLRRLYGEIEIKRIKQ